MTFVVEILTGARETEAVFFPLELRQVNDSTAQAMTPLPDGARLVRRKSSQLAEGMAGKALRTASSRSHGCGIKYAR